MTLILFSVKSPSLSMKSGSETEGSVSTYGDESIPSLHEEFSFLPRGMQNALDFTQEANRTSVTDGELLSSMRYSACLGFACLVVFGVLNAVSKLYRLRLVRRVRPR